MKVKKPLFFLLLTLLFTITPAAFAHATEYKLTASDGAREDRFGESVSISVDTAIVGARNNDDAGSNSGSAYIFVRNGDSWIEQAKLTASDASLDDFFGGSVSVNGDTAIVGASYNNDAGSNSGSAYIFVRNGDSWIEQAKLTASDAALGDFFGESVAIDGDTAIVGAYRDDNDGGEFSGSAYVFVRSGDSWIEQAKLTASDGAREDLFGESVAISGDTAIVGAHWDDDVGFNSGSAYVFVRNGDSWVEQEKLTASDAAIADNFGISVAISGDTVTIGAWGDDDAGSNSGSAYVFVRSGDSWIEQAKLTASDAAIADNFGISIAIDGDIIMVGAYPELGGAIGSAYVFVRSGDSWIEQAKLTASDGALGDFFGYSASISGDTAVIGAFDDDDAGFNSGSAYIYDELTQPNNFCEHTSIFPTSPTSSEQSVDLSEPLENFDIRTENAEVLSPDENRLQALKRLQDQLGNTLLVSWSPFNGTPSSLFNTKGFLTEASDEKPLDIALDFLESNEGLFGLTEVELSSFKDSQSTTKDNGATHIAFDQFYQDIPVFQGRLQFTITKEGQVVLTNGSYYPGITISATPRISASEALAVAVENVAPDVDFKPRIQSTSSDATQTTIFEKGAFDTTDAFHGASLVVFPVQNDARLAWQVIFHKNGTERYVFMVDAGNGEVLYRANLVDFNEPQGLVFEEDPDDADQILKSFVGDPTASPNGWVHQVGGTYSTLGGNNTCAQEDRDANQAEGYSPSETDGRFEYAFQDAYQESDGTDINTDLNTAITNLFYQNNFIHDYYYDLGFDEAAGNFQRDNFGKGGLGNDEVAADAQDGWDSDKRNGANFYTPPDGGHPVFGKPRMQVSLFTDPPYRNTDSDFDGKVIIHEYTHGLSKRLVGGPGDVSGLSGTQSRAMGEGWSDWFAASIFNDPIIGEYVTGNPLTGIRNFALNRNPLTYEDLCHVGDRGCEVHDDGEIWSGALWDLREAFVKTYGYDAGKQQVEQLVVKGLDTTEASPSMLNARTAILAADMSDGGTNQGLIWNVFACRGMGLSASSTDHNVEFPDQAFDLPDGTQSVCAKLRGPLPGIAGQINSFRAEGVTPGYSVNFISGTQLGDTTVPGCRNRKVGLRNFTLIGNAVADTNGNARLDKLIPPGAAGKTLRFQAVQPGSCQVSDLVTHTFSQSGSNQQSQPISTTAVQ